MNSMKLGALAAFGASTLLSALPAQAAEYANVVSSTPVMGSVSAPRQECFDSEQVVQRQPSGAGALIGAIAGGVIGNQFGHGFGRAAATGLGVVTGSAIGNNVEASANPATAVPVQRCRTVSGYESRVVGYDVVYDYNGQRYTTRLAQDPGARLAIDVRPAGAAPLDRVGPPASYAAAPSYYDAPAPAYEAVPPSYYAPAPVVYGPSTYIAPAVVGLGVGYWIGRSWHPGYRYGYYRRWH